MEIADSFFSLISNSLQMTFTSTRIYLAFAILFVTILFLGNSSGPASNGNYYTGAPSAGGGTESTCSTCHSSGSYGEPQLSVKFAAAGEALETLTSYIPGQTYTVEVAVGYLNQAPMNYGFQTQFINTAAPRAAAGTLAQPDADTHIITGTGGRVYAEHNKRGPDSLFTFEWTAPMAGTGTVEMYVVGNLVDSGGSTGNDNGSTAPTLITLPEGIPSGVTQLASIPHRLFPNPTSGSSILQVDLPLGGHYELRILSLDGKTVSKRNLQLASGATQVEVAAGELVTGMYLVQLTGASSRLVTRLVVN